MIFDKNVDGNLAYTKEAAHSRNRILHAQGDATGREIHLFLLEHCPHEIVTQAVVCDLLIQDDVCYGVQYFTSEYEQKVAFCTQYNYSKRWSWFFIQISHKFNCKCW